MNPRQLKSVWLLWALYYDEDVHDHTRILNGVYASRRAAEREQVAQGLTEFEIERREPTE